MGRLGRLAQIVPSYTVIAWNGLVSPRTHARGPLVVAQGIVIDGDRVLLSVRHDLRGWELPGGNLNLGECVEDALRREILEDVQGDGFARARKPADDNQAHSAS